MTLWRQVRWRIVAAQLAVVGAGVTTLLLVAEWLAGYHVAADLVPVLAALARQDGGLDSAAAAAVVGGAFRRTVAQALLPAALAATGVGLATSLLLMRDILRPLRELAAGSERIAGGSYDQRLAVSGSDEFAAVATSFNRMAAMLEQVEQHRVALIGDVAHELRTPLAGIEGYLEGLVDGVIPGDLETFTLIQQEVRRLHRLVSDLQTLSRVEAGQVPLQRRSFDGGELVQRMVAQLRPQLEGQALEITVEVPGTPLWLYADPDRTAQIVLNLVGNAIRYSPQGGQVRVRVEASGEQGQLVVADTGIGIPPEALPYLFERFYRVDASRSRRSGGSGIGLTISRHLAWQMGGTLTATSAGVGHGSTFTLRLPLGQPPDGKGEAEGYS